MIGIDRRSLARAIATLTITALTLIVVAVAAWRRWA